MRTAAEIEHQLQMTEQIARNLKQWLDENPTAPIAERLTKRARLKIALQEINDLVCELKPPLTIYPLK